VPKNVTPAKLKLLLQAFYKSTPKNKSKNNDDDEDEDDFMDVPYLFLINGHEIRTDIAECVKFQFQIMNTEKTQNIVYQPQAVFK
jgi:hypothetical protein